MDNKRLVMANYTVTVPATDVTPIGVNLIPALSSMSSTKGKVTGDSPTNKSYNVIYESDAKYYLSQYAYKIFNNSNSGTTFETKTNQGSDITYTLDPSQYNKGFFDPGTYKFSTTVQNTKIANNCYVEFLFYIKDKDDKWIHITTYTGGYKSTPVNATVEFTVDYKFKGIRMYKINSKNYIHTRNYQRYKTNLIRISK